jgi:hypothetical protein
MPSRLVQLLDTDIIRITPRSGEQPRRFVVVHISEEVTVRLMVGELEDRARFVVRAINEGKERHGTDKDNKSLMKDLEDDIELLSHLNYMIEWFGGEPENLPEEIGGIVGSPSGLLDLFGLKTARSTLISSDGAEVNAP